MGNHGSKVRRRSLFQTPKAQTGEVPGRLVDAPAGLPAATSAGLSSLLILLKNTLLIIFYDFLRFVNDLGQATWIQNTMSF